MRLCSPRTPPRDPTSSIKRERCDSQVVDVRLTEDRSTIVQMRLHRGWRESSSPRGSVGRRSGIDDPGRSPGEQRSSEQHLSSRGEEQEKEIPSGSTSPTDALPCQAYERGLHNRRLPVPARRQCCTRTRVNTRAACSSTTAKDGGSASGSPKVV